MARRISISPELKKAIQELSGKEKDKLIFRLLPKNVPLIAKLEFELLEDGDTQKLRREEMGEAIEERMADSVENFYSPGYLLLDLRAVSGAITRHVKTTRDKEGEVELNLLMLTESLPKLTKKISGFTPGKSRTLNNYVIARSRKILQLLNKFHPDLRLDYQGDLKTLGMAIGKIDSMMKTAIYEGFNVNWLIGSEWPEDL